MQVGSRLLIRHVFLASTVALTAALGSGLGLAGAANEGEGPKVTLTSTPAVATVVSHKVVNHSSESNNGDSSGDSAQLPAMRAKQGATRSAAHSDSNVSESALGDGGGTPPLGASFIGQQGSKTTCSYFAKGCNPPDMALAAGGDFVLQGVNTQWEVFDRSGNIQGSPIGAQRFFGVPNATKADGTPCDVAHQSQPFLSDPRALYDTSTGRFWAAMLQVEGGLGVATDCAFKSVYLIAVSQTHDPTGAWNVYEFDMTAGTNNAADFTMIGINGDAIYFSANMFGPDPDNFYAYAEIFEANKAKMEAGQGGFTADGFLNLQATGPGTTAKTGPFLADTVQPVINQNGGGGDGLFIDTIDGPDPVNGHDCTSAAQACRGLLLWRIQNPIAHDSGGADPVLIGTYLPNTKPQTFPPPSNQPSCNACIDSSDLRIGGIPVMRDGVIYAAWGTGVDNGTQVVPGIEWAKVRANHPTGESGVKTGYYNFSGDAAATYPALTTDTQGNLAMVFEFMSHDTFPQSRYIVTGADGKFSGAGRLLKAGEANYRPTLCGTAALPVCRWGDYEAASFDGDNSIWLAGEYTNTATDPNASPTFGRNWGTWIGGLLGLGG